LLLQWEFQASLLQTRPCPTHWQALKRVLWYLKATSSHGLVFGQRVDSGNNVLYGYSDADWAGDVESRHSTSGFVFLLHGGCVSWQSKKQRPVALSSTEAVDNIDSRVDIDVKAPRRATQ